MDEIFATNLEFKLYFRIKRECEPSNAITGRISTNEKERNIINWKCGREGMRWRSHDGKNHRPRKSNLYLYIGVNEYFVYGNMFYLLEKIFKVMPPLSSCESKLSWHESLEGKKHEQIKSSVVVREGMKARSMFCVRVFQ